MLAAVASMMLFSLGAPAWATSGQNGPSTPDLGDPVTAPRLEIQSVKILATSGTFTLTIGACTTAAVAYNVAASALQTAIQVCSAGATVSGRDGIGYKVTFTAAAGNVAQMTETPTTAADVFTIQEFSNAGWVAPGAANATTTNAPHGGYSSLTDYCLQCHAVHGADAATEFSLMRAGSVTATCNTCHVMFGTTGGITPFDSNGALATTGLTMGTAAARSAYDLGDGGLINGGAVVRGHQIGGTGNGAVTGDFALSDGVVLITQTAYESTGLGEGDYFVNETGAVDPKASGTAQAGLYCASCHTPHGEFGQMVNDWYMSTLSGTTTAAAAATSITVTGAAFTDADLKKSIRIVGAGTAGADLWTRIATRTSATVITIVDAIVTGVAGANVYLGDEGFTTYRRNSTTGVYDPYTLDYDGETTVDTATGWRRCSAANGAPVIGTDYNTACTSWATASDAEGQTVYQYGYKLLSSGPNHQYLPADVKTYGLASGGDDSAEWCGTCHTDRWNDPNGTHANHPGSCTRCHGNPADQTSFDFPHTSSVARLLTQLPDGLCIRCHSELP